MEYSNSIDRKEYILKSIDKYDFVNVKELSEALGVSEMTIRRDLSKLSEEKSLIRVHGGAKSFPTGVYEEPLDLRQQKNKKEKIKIGECAEKFIKNGDIIALDASSTAYELANIIKRREKEITVITNNISIVHILVDSDLIDVVLLGGEVRKNSLSTVGFETVDMMNNYVVDKAFISSKAIDYKHGLTDSTTVEAEAKKAMINSSKKTYVLMDNTKIDTYSFYRVSQLSDISNIITDNIKTNKKFWENCEEKNINVYSAK